MTQADTYEDYRSDTPELPVRPRRKIVTPVTIGLLLVFVAALGFAGGILVQRDRQTGTSSLASSGFPGARTGATASAGSAFGRGGGATIGTVSTVNGNKLYVSTVTGGTVEVRVTGVSKITKSTSAKLRAIHPGDSVVVSGIASSKTGVVTASSISDSGTGGGASLFGGLGAAPSSGSGSTSGGAPSSSSLFGN